MPIKRESGYLTEYVFDWLRHHGETDDNGRYWTLNGHLLRESHRNTIDRWAKHPTVPLVRFDEILTAAGVHLWEFEDWTTYRRGETGFVKVERGPNGDNAILESEANHKPEIINEQEQ